MSLKYNTLHPRSGLLGISQQGLCPIHPDADILLASILLAYLGRNWGRLPSICLPQKPSGISCKITESSHKTWQTTIASISQSPCSMHKHGRRHVVQIPCLSIDESHAKVICVRETHCKLEKMLTVPAARPCSAHPCMRCSTPVLSNVN